MRDIQRSLMEISNLPVYVINHIMNAVQKQIYGVIKYRMPVGKPVDFRFIDRQEVQKCTDKCYQLFRQYNVA